MRKYIHEGTCLCTTEKKKWRWGRCIFIYRCLMKSSCNLRHWIAIKAIRFIEKMVLLSLTLWTCTISVAFLTLREKCPNTEVLLVLIWTLFTEGKHSLIFQSFISDLLNFHECPCLWNTLSTNVFFLKGLKSYNKPYRMLNIFYGMTSFWWWVLTDDFLLTGRV